MAEISTQTALEIERARSSTVNWLRQLGYNISVNAEWDDIQAITQNMTSNDVARGLLDGTIIGEYVDNEILRLQNYAFNGCSGLTSISLPNLVDCGNYAFNGCSSLNKLELKKLTLVGSSGLRNCGAIIIYIPSSVSNGNSAFRQCTRLKEAIMPSNLSNSNETFIDANGIELIDFGKSPNCNNQNINNKPNFSKLILRKADSISTLGATSNFNSTPFNTSGGNGKVYVPTSLKSTYENASNWSALVGTTFINIEDSRFKDEDWYEKRNSTCSLDGNTIDVLDTETVAIFKTTENIQHLYENGTEVTDTTELVKDRTFTSTI